MDSLNKRDVIVNRSIHYFENQSFFFRRFFFSYVPNRLFACQVEIQIYIHICSICLRIYARIIRRNGGKQRWNKRKSQFARKMELETLWIMIFLGLGRNS